jgi:hypothetical protein
MKILPEVFILGPEQMTFQKVKAPILDSTLKLVANYQEQLRTLHTCFAKDSKDLQARYNRDYDKLVSDTNTKLAAFFVDKAK